MTPTVYALQSVLGTTDCQFVADPARRSRWLPDETSRSLWQRLSVRAAELEIDWVTGAEACLEPPLDLGPILLNRLSPANAAVRRFGLLDGYRRMMSVVVLLAALGGEAQSRGDSVGAARIRDKYLINRYAQRSGDRWRLIPSPTDADGWEQLMTGHGGPTELLLPAAESVAGWYSSAPEREVAAATYRLERAVAGWTSVEEHVAPDA
jgi:hypothetical protein